MKENEVKEKIIKYLKERGEADTEEIHRKIGGDLEDIILALDKLREEGIIGTDTTKTELWGRDSVIRFERPLDFRLKHEKECFKTRILKRPIPCWIMEFEEGDIFLWSHGKTKKEAEESMAVYLEVLYEEYGLESDSMLSKGARDLKTWLLQNVVIEKRR